MLGHEVVRNTSFNGEIYILRNIAGSAGHFQSVQLVNHHAFAFADGAVPKRCETFEIGADFQESEIALGVLCDDRHL